MDIDVLEYKSVIERVLSRLKIPADQREDLSQECYVALLEKKHHVQKGIDKGRGEAYAARICESEGHSLRVLLEQFWSSLLHTLGQTFFILFSLDNSPCQVDVASRTAAKNTSL